MRDLFRLRGKREAEDREREGGTLGGVFHGEWRELSNSLSRSLFYRSF